MTDAARAKGILPPVTGTAPITVIDHQHLMGLQPIPAQSSPWLLLVSDALLLLREAPYALLLFWPPNLRDGGIFQDLTLLGAIFQVICLAVSLAITALVILSVTIGTPSIFITLIVSVAATLPLQLVQGALVVKARRMPPNPDKFSRESWFFVNGIATSRSGSILAVQRLQDLFGRPIMGIHNRTLGMWGDLLECVLQRDLSYKTRDIREGYSLFKDAVLDDSKSRIVLIAHSQGGIIASAWADALLADVDRERLSRVEIYTFASAANHFSAPPGRTGRSPWANVEHFANANDYVARIGVLAFAKPNPAQKSSTLMATTTAAAYSGTGQNIDDLKETATQQRNESPDGMPYTSSRFAGRLFLRSMASGHLLVDHYLGPHSNILDIPAAQRNSKIASYMGGANPAS